MLEKLAKNICAGRGDVIGVLSPIKSARPAHTIDMMRNESKWHTAKRFYYVFTSRTTPVPYNRKYKAYCQIYPKLYNIL